MSHAISVELQFFLVSILWGALLLMVYDVIRIFRRIIKHGYFLISMEDLIFWVCASLFIFIMMYKENNGIIRGFSVLGMAIGMTVYHMAISEAFVTLLTKLIHMILSPFLLIIRKVIKIAKFVAKKGKIVINYHNKRLKKRMQSVRIRLSAKKQKSLTKRQLKREEKRKKKQRLDDIKSAKKKAGDKKAGEKKGNRKPQTQDGKKQPVPEMSARRVVEVHPVPLKKRDK